MWPLDVLNKFMIITYNQSCLKSGWVSVLGHGRQMSHLYGVVVCWDVPCVRYLSLSAVPSSCSLMMAWSVDGGYDRVCCWYVCVVLCYYRGHVSESRAGRTCHAEMFDNM